MSETPRGFIKINGTYIPYPKRDGLTVTCTTFVNSARNANGSVTGETIGREQYKLSLKWAWLDGETWASICTELAKFNLDVEFFNPTTNSLLNIKMYPGDRTATPYFLSDDGLSVSIYSECSVNLIDMGVQ